MKHQCLLCDNLTDKLVCKGCRADMGDEYQAMMRVSKKIARDAKKRLDTKRDS